MYWDLTATTVYCQAIDEEVTLLVSAEGICRCTGRQKYAKPARETARSLKTKSRRLGKDLGCPPTECAIIIRFRDTTLGKQEPAQ